MVLPLYLLNVISGVLGEEIIEQTKEKAVETGFVLTKKSIEKTCTNQAVGNSILSGSAVWVALTAGVQVGGRIVILAGGAANPIGAPLLLVNGLSVLAGVISFKPMQKGCKDGLVKTATSVELNDVVKEVINRNPAELVDTESLGKWARITNAICHNLRETPFWQGRIVQLPRKMISSIFECDIL